MQSKLIKIKESRWITRLLSPLMLVLLMVIFSIASGGRFSNLRNLKMVVDQALVVATVATGAVFIFSTGNVNIAMGAATALVATISAELYMATGSVALMMVSAVVAGVILMALTALLSTSLRVPVLFVTVVMMTFLSSLQKGILGANQIYLPYEMTSGLNNAYVPYIFFILFFLLCIVLFHFTSLGRKLRYLGINRRCAELTGFSNRRYLFLAFMVAGLGVGFGAIITLIRGGSVTVDTCSSLNMDCMLAIVLGGMSCFGGSRSNVWCAIVGAVMVTVLNNGMLMLGVSNTVLQGIRGVIFIVLLCLSQTRPKGIPSNDI